MNTVQKPGLLTTEFWLTVAAVALVGLGAIDASTVGTPWEAILAVGGTVGYALSRAIAKHGPGVRTDDAEPVNPFDVARTPKEVAELEADQERALADRPPGAEAPGDVGPRL